MVMPRLRTVKPRPNAGPPGSSVYTADSLLLAPDRLGVWAETNFSAQPSQLIANMAKDPALADKTLSQEPLSVAVTVTEPQPPKPGGDPHDFMRQMEQKPRLVVFGSSAFASNPLMTERAGGAYFTLLNSTLSWLREHPCVPWRMFECLVETDDGMFIWPDEHWLPLAFSLRAARPAA